MITPDDIRNVRVAMLALYPEAAEAYWTVRYGNGFPQLRGRVGDRVIYVDTAMVLMHTTDISERHITRQHLEQIAEAWNKNGHQ